MIDKEEGYNRGCHNQRSKHEVIHIFRTNLLINSLLLLVYTAVIRLSSIVQPLSVHVPEQSNAIQEWLLTWTSSSRLLAVCAILLVYIQALFINRLIIKNRLGQEITMLPGMLYVLLMSCLPDQLQWNLALIANTLLIVGLSRIYQGYRQPQAAVLTFDTGLYFGVASIVYAPYLVLCLLGYISLVILRSIKWKDRIQYFTGLIIPYGLWWIWSYYWTGGWPTSYVYGLFSAKLPHLNTTMAIATLAVASTLSIITVLVYGRNISKKAIQVQKKIDILYWLLLCGGISIFHKSATLALVSIIAPALAFSFSQCILRVGNLLLTEIAHIALIILLMVVHYGLI